MSWKGLLAALLLASLIPATPADEVESTPGLSDHLTPPLVQRLRELVAPATDKVYTKCLATLAPPALCECMTRRIALRFDWLCEVKVIHSAGSTTKQNVSAALRPLFPTRFYLLHPWSRAHLTSRDGGNARGL